MHGDDKDKTNPQGGSSKPSKSSAKRAANLRANLMRRKEQARTREDPAAPKQD